jgi:hypothetical protein
MIPPEPCGQTLNLWSQPEFMQAVMNLHNSDGFHLQCYKGNQLIAVLPIFEKKLLSYRAVICPSTSYYQAVNLWIEDSSRPARKLLETLQALRQIAAFLRDRYKRIHFNLSPDTYDVRGFTWEKLKAKPLYTFTYNYADALTILPDEKNKLTKAKQQGYRFGEELRLPEFIKLTEAMNGRKKHELGIDYDALESFFVKLHELGILRQYNLYLEDRIVSSNILLKGGDGKAYTVLRATEEAALKNGASSLHTIRLIDSLKDELTELDFCGANVPEVARFKAALGLKLKVFFQIHT